MFGDDKPLPNYMPPITQKSMPKHIAFATEELTTLRHALLFYNDRLPPSDLSGRQRVVDLLRRL